MQVFYATTEGHRRSEMLMDETSLDRGDGDDDAHDHEHHGGDDGEK